MLGCVGVSGYIRNFALTDDGDLVLDFDVDKDFQTPTYINAKNKSGNNGFMVVEFPCQGLSSWPLESASSCKGFQLLKIDIEWIKYLIRNQVHVRIDGILVLDDWHGWIELHPASEITDLTPFDS